MGKEEGGAGTVEGMSNCPPRLPRTRFCLVKQRAWLTRQIFESLKSALRSYKKYS